MIKSKQDLLEYLEADKNALDIHDRKKPRFLHDIIWSYQILMRKCEYYQNCKKGFFSRLYSKILKYRFVKLGQKLGFSIPLNVFGKGLSLAHRGTVVVNANAKVGDYCRIHEGVTIGVSGADYKIPGTNEGAAAEIGNRVFIATGAKIIGRVKIADGVAIGANSVVVKDILEPNTTWAGIPAKKISDNGSDDYIFGR